MVVVAAVADEEAEEVTDVDISTCTITNYFKHSLPLHTNQKIQ